MPTVLWWGRFDPDYSRNRILRRLFAELDWTVEDFQPSISPLGAVEARLRHVPPPDLVWVPCFRQRDLATAACWARQRGVPLVFDPLISAYDKQVDERKKLVADSPAARRLLASEQALFAQADFVIADTPAHADYFHRVLGVDPERLQVIYVGAEEDLFTPAPLPSPSPGQDGMEVLFFGSFIPLQGPGVVVEAARCYQGPPVRWTLLGQGPLRSVCEPDAQGLDSVCFEDWLPYEQLPSRIHRAGILLGVFGNTPKADRVIPNKVYQSLACGRVVVTRMASAYPGALITARDSGIVWTDAGDARALAASVAELAADPERVRQLGKAAAETSREWFSLSKIRRQLRETLDKITVLTGRTCL